MLGLIFTFAMTFGGGAVALFNPYVGFLVYVAFAILKPEYLWYWAVTPWHYSRVVAIALLIGWFLGGFGSWRLGRGRAIVIALVGYWIWSIVSALFAPNQEVAWAFVTNLSKVVVPFVAGLAFVDSAQKLKQLAWVIVLTHGFLAYEFNISYYDGFNRLRTVGHGGMDDGSVAVAMVAASGVAFFLGLRAPRLWQKVLAFGLTILMLHAVLFSFSRSGMLGLIAAFLVAFWLLPKKPRHYLALAFIVLLGLRLAGREVRQEFWSSFADEQTRDYSAQSRLDLWSACWDSMLERPLLGVGPDHFPLIAEAYGFPPGKEAHNLWLQIGAEMGFPGMLFLLAFYSLCMLRVWSIARERLAMEDPWLCDVARMTITALSGFVVAACFISLEGLEAPYYIAVLGVGVLKLQAMAVPQSRTEPVPHLAPALTPTLQPRNRLRAPAGAQ